MEELAIKDNNFLDNPTELKVFLESSLHVGK